MSRPDLDPAVREIMAKTVEQHRADIAKPQADEDLDLIPTPLDAVIAGLVAIAAVCIGIAAVIGVIHILAG